MDIKTREKLTKRHARLKALQSGIDSAVASLRSLPRHPAEIRVRSGFVYRDEAAPIEPSDRRLPPKEYRPPATRLFSPGGSALSFYLLALYEAHLHARPGQEPSNRFPLIDYDNTGRGWTDLIAAREFPKTGSTRTSTRVVERKLRRIISALTTLEKIGLVELPNKGKPVGTYAKFQLMNEAGRRPNADPIPYVVPRHNDNYFSLPAELFHNGWIHVLEDSELAVLMMLIYWKRTTGSYVKVDSSIRLLHFGVGRDTYEAHRLLARFGLLELIADDRRSDGTVIDRKELGFDPLHKFLILNDGFDHSAVDMACQGIEAELREA